MDDTELMRRVAAGDAEAFTEVYRRRQGAVYRHALRMTGSRSTAEDATQEVFLALMRSAGDYDPGKGPCAAYIFGIARHVVRRLLERQRPHGNLAEATEPVASDDPLSEIFRVERIGSVRDAVLALPVHYREVVSLCDLEEMTYAQAAAVLGCAEGTVRSRLHRARAVLAGRLRAAGERAAAAGPAPRKCLV